MYLPSPAVADWQAAIATMALAAGWAVVDPGHPAPEAPGPALIIFSPDVEPAIVGPEAMIVVAAPSEVVRQQIAHETGLDGIDLLRATANVMAVGAELARKGARVVAFDALSLDIPGMGTIVRSDTHRRPALRSGGPLAFYDALPVPVGANAAWPPTVFNWVGEVDGKADLTGRRRVLQYGPYFNLFPGEWTITTRFELAIDRAIVELRFEWGTEFDVVVMSQILRTPGVYTVTLKRAWPAIATSEFRIWLDRAIFDGQITILDCVVTHSGIYAPAETLPELVDAAD